MIPPIWGIEPDEDLCTLVTCTPTGVNTHRLLVQGSRIPYVPTEETEASAVPHEENTDSNWEKQYWLGVRLGLATMATVVLLLSVYLFFRKKKTVKRRKEAAMSESKGKILL